MCGILGKLTFRGKHEPRHVFERAINLLRHRGPDDYGVHYGRSRSGVEITLAQTRLSILDLSAAGHQPMQSPRTGIWMVYNGEVYNFREVRARLEREGFSFQSQCDTEVIIAAYDHRPEDFVADLRGMFAVAIWDTERERLELVRDRLGIKPLYYYWDGDQFAFASEVTALAALPTLKLEVCQEAIGQFLLYGYIPAPLSIFKNVYKLPAAHRLTLDLSGGEPAVRRYWNAVDAYAEPQSFGDENAVLEALGHELTEAVRLRLVSDVPLGAFLSGGIDSSLVVALMRRVHSGRIRTFTIGFSVPDWNEAPAAQRIAEHLGTDHEQCYLSEKNIYSAARDVSEYFDEPFADESNIPTLALSRMTREHVTVALSGDGGDELFWGYKNYTSRSMKLYNLLRFLPCGFRRALGASLRMSGHSRWSQWSEWVGFDDFSSFYVRPQAWLAGSYPGLQLKPAKSNRLLEIGREVTAPLPRNDADLLSGVIDLHGYMVDDILTKVDRASMSVSLEARVPILDHKVVELAAGIPTFMKTVGREPKHLLKALLARYLPRELWKRPKMGFGVPLVHWLRGPLKEWAYGELTSTDTHLHDWLDRDELQSLFEDHSSKRRDVAKLIWACTQLAGWDRRITRIRRGAAS